MTKRLRDSTAEPCGLPSPRLVLYMEREAARQLCEGIALQRTEKMRARPHILGPLGCTNDGDIAKLGKQRLVPEPCTVGDGLDPVL